MSKIIRFDVINNCNRDITIRVNGGTLPVRKGQKITHQGPEGAAVEVYPYNAAYTKQVGTVSGATIAISGYDK